ncbi:hypothetical protein VHEMI08879 [[Torrubiella] hemipterigena]|uniref:Peptidase C14 caspase domain-containing protein n=1 Tax=[Torrubiella] hemipterigena TaxID=1531966 RepID=A0A0A1TP13_9HYPO|nr:hypothetical protein VHEMI08879 [[Torrubiella] hemipterigena]
MGNYAILIGIDQYTFEPLRGSVRDVRRFHRGLQQIDPTMDIQLLTTATGSDTPVADTAMAKSPTYNNVVTALESVMRSAGQGDFVYIHFSGHGTCLKPTAKFSNTATGDLALVLLESETDFQGRCLGGPRLATMLNTLVHSGVVLTITLDCCYAGAVYRHDDDEDDLGTRCLPFTPAMYAQYLEDNYAADVYLDNTNRAGEMRNGSLRSNWLLDPAGYVIISASGMLEKAREIQLNGEIHGSLSFFLGEALFQLNGLKLELGHVFNHVRARFSEHSLLQNPTLYGNRHGRLLQLSSHTLDIPTTAISVIVRRDGSLELQAGRAHGVGDGDTFSLHKFGHQLSPSSGTSTQAIVREAKALTSLLDYIVDTESACNESSAKTNLIAIPIKTTGLSEYPVRIYPKPSNSEHRVIWQDELQNRCLSSVEDQSLPTTFHVSLQYQQQIQEQLHIEFLISTPNFPALQPVSDTIICQDYKSGVAQICDTLVHMAQFMMVRDLHNPQMIPGTSPFLNLFSVYIENNGQHKPGNLIRVQHENEIQLLLGNRTNHSLYFYVFILTPGWGVKNLCAGRNTEVTRYRTKTLSLKMSVPVELQNAPVSRCQDNIKVFVTKQSTSFESLQLPDWHRLPATNEPDNSRSGGGDAESKDWAAVSFPIETVYGSSA